MKIEDLNNANHWDAVAVGYANFVGPIFEEFIDRFADRLGLERDTKILDLACGPGTASIRIHERVASVEGLDFSAKMISTFNQTIEEKGITNINTHIGDGQDLSRFSDDSFDVAISLFGLIFFPDRLQALKEVRRVLKPNGRVLITGWPPMADSSFMTTLFDAIQSTGCMSDPKDPGLEDVGTPDPTVFVSEFRAAGFKTPQQEIGIMDVEIQDVEDFWEQNVRGSIPLYLIKKGMDDEKWNELCAKALDHLKASLKPPCSLILKARVWLVNL